MNLTDTKGQLLCATCRKYRPGEYGYYKCDFCGSYVCFLCVKTVKEKNRRRAWRYCDEEHKQKHIYGEYDSNWISPGEM